MSMASFCVTRHHWKQSGFVIFSPAPLTSGIYSHWRDFFRTFLSQVQTVRASSTSFSMTDPLIILVALWWTCSSMTVNCYLYEKHSATEMCLNVCVLLSSMNKWVFSVWVLLFSSHLSLWSHLEIVTVIYLICNTLLNHTCRIILVVTGTFCGLWSTNHILPI